jgi:lysophospholipase L1-like esterase
MPTRTLLLTLLFALLPLGARAADANVLSRGNLDNARHQFEQQKTGHVAFLGGSITEMEGYRPMVCELLKQRFPKTEFTFTAAGISSTCSTTGAFRLGADILSKGPVDLLFVEFAVNDDQDAHHAREACIRGMEGIIRHLRIHNPRADVVMTFFLNENSMKKYNAGEVPMPVAAHTEVAEHYQVSTINLAKTVTARIAAAEFDWKKFGGVHPAPFGNRIAADMIAQLFDSQWSAPPGETPAPHPLPEKPLDPANYSKGRFLPHSDLTLGEGFAEGIPDWKSIPGSKRERFNTKSLVSANQPGAVLTSKFEGSAIGAFVLAGPDAGMVEASIDGAAPVKVNLFHSYSKGLHYPRTVMFADGLSNGSHTLRLTVSAEKDPASTGHAFRAMHFVVNDGR